MSNEKMCIVTNRSAGQVSYHIPEDNIHRRLQPGESRKVKFSELEKLSYQRGGDVLLAQFLQVKDVDVLNELSVHAEPEYFMDEAQIVDLIKNGSLDAWLDCLDFAPVGVMDIIKRLSVSIPLSDYQKRVALKEKTGFDVDAAIRNAEEDRDDGAKTKPERRIKDEKSTAAPARRTAPVYTILNKTK